MLRSIAVQKQAKYLHLHVLSEDITYKGNTYSDVTVSYSHVANETCVFGQDKDMKWHSLPGEQRGDDMERGLDSFLHYFNEYALEKGE